jgi:hypothetical protein
VVEGEDGVSARGQGLDILEARNEHRRALDLHGLGEAEDAVAGAEGAPAVDAAVLGQDEAGAVAGDGPAEFGALGEVFVLDGCPGRLGQPACQVSVLLVLPFHAATVHKIDSIEGGESVPGLFGSQLSKSTSSVNLRLISGELDTRVNNSKEKSKAIVLVQDHLSPGLKSIQNSCPDCLPGYNPRPLAIPIYKSGYGSIWASFYLITSRVNSYQSRAFFTPISQTGTFSSSRQLFVLRTVGTSQFQENVEICSQLVALSRVARIPGASHFVPTLRLLLLPQ